MESCIKQGCPLSENLFAIALDPMMRRYLSTLTGASSRLCAFADDVGVATHDLEAHLREVIPRYRQSDQALALKSNMRRSVCPFLRGSCAARRGRPSALLYAEACQSCLSAEVSGDPGPAVCQAAAA